METATFGGGCFWCIETVFNRIEGVESAVSGYMGGHTENPDYAAVCSGTTGHVEVVAVRFDPAAVSYDSLLDVFFTIHDPTQLNRQGNDVGTQYRSVIFWHTEAQRETAAARIAALDAAGVYGAPIVTALEPAGRFYPAEAHHQRYFEHHPDQPYCRLVVAPKVQKAMATFSDRIKR